MIKVALQTVDPMVYFYKNDASVPYDEVKHLPAMNVVISDFLWTLLKH